MKEIEGRIGSGGLVSRVPAGMGSWRPCAMAAAIGIWPAKKLRCTCHFYEYTCSSGYTREIKIKHLFISNVTKPTRSRRVSRMTTPQPITENSKAFLRARLSLIGWASRVESRPRTDTEFGRSLNIANMIGTGVFLKARVMTCNMDSPVAVLAVAGCRFAGPCRRCVMRNWLQCFHEPAANMFHQ
jgi:hypothetical protein